MTETKLLFRRYEKKYLLPAEKYPELLARLEGHVEPDEFHVSTVSSLYYDADDYRLIRRSIDEPTYKEKLRVRAYDLRSPEDGVFVELKKKLSGVVYKRRVPMTETQALRWLAGEAPPPADGQTEREIAWFLRLNRPAPKVLISCDRTAWRAVGDPELRFTFDENIRWRRDELRLSAGSAGQPMLPDGTVLMEIKLPTAAPLWLAGLLSDEKLFPGSFSKYGTCYRENLLQDFLGRLRDPSRG